MDTHEPWYADGLHFTCTGCGDCCTGAPGAVWVTDEEIEQIARTTGKPVEEIRLLHTRPLGDGVSLTERTNGDCTFFDGVTRRCTIYAARPRQCRSWPFWPSNLTSPHRWQQVQQHCPGSNGGTFFSLDEIRRQAALVEI